MFTSPAMAAITAEDDLSDLPTQIFYAMEMCSPDRQLGMLRASLPMYGLTLPAARLADATYADRFLTVLRRRVSDWSSSVRMRAADNYYRSLA